LVPNFSQLTEHLDIPALIRNWFFNNLKLY
jgi:hypothetical protein